MRGSMLKQILDDKGITISELARRLNAPAQTLYSMVKRDNQKVDFDLMMRICSELNVPVERMCENISLPRLPDGREWELVTNYRQLDDNGKSLVDTVIDHELSRLESAANAEKPAISKELPPSVSALESERLYF